MYLYFMLHYVVGKKNALKVTELPIFVTLQLYRSPCKCARTIILQNVQMIKIKVAFLPPQTSPSNVFYALEVLVSQVLLTLVTIKAV